MSQVKRKGLKFIIDQIGKAKYIYKNLVGDLTVNRGLFLDYEAIVPKIKGSTIFHDYDLAGKTLSNNLSYVMPVTDVAQSANPVLIDTTDNIQFLVTANNMRCTGGRAIIPAQNIGTQSLVLDLSDPSNDARLRNILFGSANVPVTTESKFSNDVTLSVVECSVCICPGTGVDRI
jgi:hypothetical protein